MLEENQKNDFDRPARIISISKKISEKYAFLQRMFSKKAQ